MKKKLLIILQIVLFSCLAMESQASVYYVKTTGSNSNNGTTWALAKADVQAAINASSAGDEIWIAAGTYKPTLDPSSGTASGNTRDYAFYLLGKDIGIYGGFAGTETARTQRNIATNPVILSGDIGTANDNTDNCYHVFVTSAYLTSAAVLDGFSVQEGNANGSGSLSISSVTFHRYTGGGIANGLFTRPTLSNLTISDNNATNGGGISLQNSNAGAAPALTNVTISGNTATSLGGGLYNYKSPATFTNVTISGNAASTGGGMYNFQTAPTITNTTFSANTASGSGGGIYNFQSSSPTIANSIFWGNLEGSSSTATGSDIENGSGTTTVTYSLMQLASSSYTSGNNNLLTSASNNSYNSDPLFVDASNIAGADGIHRTADDGLRLFSTSPAANSGSNSAIPSGITTDIIGSARTQNTTVNMGAYEDLTTVCSSTSALPTTASTTYTADYKNTDANGWTNYCSVDEKLLLSLKIGSSGAVVAASEVELKLGSSTTYSYVGNDGGMISTGNKGYVMIDRRWDVSPTTQPSSNVGVKYYFTNSEYTDLASALSTHNSSATGYSSTLSSVTDVDLYKSTSGSAFADPHTVSGIIIDNGSTPSDIIWNRTLHGTADHSAEFEVTSFSGGGGGGGGGGGTGAAPLPVKLIHFTAQAMAYTTAELNWATATEIENSHFVIERSYDGLTFEAIDRVEGNGNSDEVLHYAYTDRGIAQGSEVVHYRLHQFDYNGTSEYSDVRKVSFDINSIAKPSIAIYPNPFTSDVYINLSTLSGAEATIKVTNLSGQQLLERSIDDTQSIEKIDLSSLPKGIYFVHITTATGNTIVKVIKG
jgi:hypothetical protein